MKVWDRAGIELVTSGSAVRHASVARHVTDCTTRPGEKIHIYNLPIYISLKIQRTLYTWPENMYCLFALMILSQLTILQSYWGCFPLFLGCTIGYYCSRIKHSAYGKSRTSNPLIQVKCSHN